MSVTVAVVVTTAIMIVIAVMVFVFVIAVALGVNRRGANGCGQRDPQRKLPCRNLHRRTSKETVGNCEMLIILAETFGEQVTEGQYRGRFPNRSAKRKWPKQQPRP